MKNAYIYRVFALVYMFHYDFDVFAVIKMSTEVQWL